MNRALVSSEKTLACAFKIAFVACVGKLAGMRALVRTFSASRLRCCFQLVVATNQLVRCIMRSGNLSPLSISKVFIGVTAEVFAIRPFIPERDLDGEQNQILPCTEIARESSLERQPNAARRNSILSSANRGADKLGHGDLEDLVRNRG